MRMSASIFLSMPGDEELDLGLGVTFVFGIPFLEQSRVESQKWRGCAESHGYD